MPATAHLRRAQVRRDFSRVVYRCGTLLGRPRRERFLRQMPKGAVCAEIGVFRGEYSPGDPPYHPAAGTAPDRRLVGTVR